MWRWWVLSCLVIGAAHWFAISQFPVVHQDGIQILESGRLALDPDTDWSVSWNIPADRARLSWAYAGAILPELGYQAASSPALGPKLIALLGALAAATCALLWLRSRGVPPWVSLALAFVFLTDGMFVTSYLQDRIDGWAIAGCLLAASLLRQAADPLEAINGRLMRVFASGALLGASPFLWPSALMLAPIVVFEWFLVLWKGAAERASRKSPPSLSLFLAFIVGGVVSVASLLVPVMLDLESYRLGFSAMMDIQTRAATIQPPVLDLFATYSPLLSLTVLAALCWRRNWVLILLCVPAILMAFGTMIHTSRLVYLLPYLIAVVGFAFKDLHASRRFAFSTIVVALLVINVAMNAYSALIARPLVAWHQGVPRAQQAIEITLLQEIGRGPKRVLLEPWSLYHAARELGWKAYRAGAPVAIADHRRFMQAMDFVIVDAHPLDPAVGEQAKALGFELQSVVQVPALNALAFQNSPWQRGSVPGTADLLIFRNPYASAPSMKAVSKVHHP